MKKPIFTLEELAELGFIYRGKEEMEEGDFYRWWVLEKNDCELDITMEFNSKFEMTKTYITFNGEVLKGRKITKKDIKFLIELM